MCMSIGWNPFYGNEQKTIEPWILHDFDSDFYGVPQSQPQCLLMEISTLILLQSISVTSNDRISTGIDSESYQRVQYGCRPLGTGLYWETGCHEQS